MKAVAFEIQPEINGCVEKLVIFLVINLLYQPSIQLTEYSDNYSDTSGSLWGFKRDYIVDNADVTNEDNAPSFKYKAGIIGDLGDNGRKNGVKITVPLKYFSNFWRSLKMPLINCKVDLSLNWIERCLLSVANTAIFEIIDAKIYVPVVTLLRQCKIIKTIKRRI